jgi:GAF domain-containing protein
LNVDRLLRKVEGRLADWNETDRLEVMDLLREAVARERRFDAPAAPVEAERERRRSAEELKQAFEAIHRSVRPAEALDEVLKQLERVVPTDFAALLVAEPGAGLRLAAARGGDLERLVGTRLEADARVAEVVDERRVVVVADAEADGAPFPLGAAQSVGPWIALPLLLEGELVGLLLAARHAPSAFGEEELQQAKSVASFTAATLRRVQAREQLRRYASLLEQVVDVDQRVFRDEGELDLARAILDGACRVGGYPAGLLLLQTSQGLVVAAANGDALVPLVGQAAPPELAATAPRRLPPERLPEIGAALGSALPAAAVYLVPLADEDVYVGCLALVDPNGESPEDRLIEAFAARTALAFRHARERHPGTGPL